MLEAVYGPCRSERTEPWYPDVFTSTKEAAIHSERSGRLHDRNARANASSQPISKCCSVCGKLVRLISDRSSEAAIVILDWPLASYSTRAGASLWSSAAPVAAGGRKQAIRFEREGGGVREIRVVSHNCVDINSST